MVSNRKKVFVALSGGVDSSVAAALLNQNGFDCSGVFITTCDESHHARADAEQIAKKLGIKLHILDLRKDFEHILDYFCSEYKKGRTPNPCVFCNRHIKFGKLWNFARSNGAELLATGQYARIFEHNNQTGLYEGLNSDKDQSYVLSMIDKKILPYIILPMGEYSKDQARQMAKKFNLGIEHKTESQEICFIPNDNHIAVLEQRCPELVRKGNIIDSSGKVLGQHDGIHRFTIGQRRGLRVAMGKPYYVVKIDAATNTITLGPKEELMQSKFWATNVNWLIENPFQSFKAKVKIRYNDTGSPANVQPQGKNVMVELNEPNSAITPGQLAAFYIQEGKNSKCIGGAWIDKVVN